MNRAIADCGLRIAALRIAAVRIAAFVLLAALPAAAQTERPSDGAQSKPAVGPEKPFQLAPRVERTLPNGLRVIATKQTAIPKVSITLTVAVLGPGLS